MFTKRVTDDDHFMGLSASAQALYLHLSMAADDDGFCNQVAVCMFKAHASTSDLEALLSNRYLYQFDNGVIVIKHWRMANALRKDRYTPTVFQEELSHLQIKDNGAYTLVAERLPDGCQVVAACLPQDRLGKDRLDKSRLEEDKDTLTLTGSSVCAQGSAVLESYFDTFWREYPKKKSKGTARKAFEKALKRTDFDTIMTALRALKETKQWKKNDGEFVPYPSTWLNAEGWEDEVRSADGFDNLRGLYEMFKEDEDNAEK
jgi:hypothetical protein